MENRPKHMILCTIGTRGDIFPFAQIAANLRALGAKVTFLSNSNWKQFAIDADADFIPIADPDPSQSKRDDKRFFLDNVISAHQNTFNFIAEQVSRGESPILVGKNQMLGIEVAAKKFGLRHANIALQPSAVTSCMRPSWPLSRFFSKHDDAFDKRFILPAIYKIGAKLSPYRKATSKFWSTNGTLPPQRKMPPKLPGDVVALLCPEWFAMPAPDWQHNIQFGGFPIDNANSNEDIADSVSFLKDAALSIIATPGTGVVDTEIFFDRISTAAKFMRAKVLFISPHIKQSYSTSNVMICDFMPLAKVLPFCDLIIHHGGIGTTGTAVTSQCPQLIIAGRFDQPDNAVRVAQLGLGGAILESSPQADTICAAINRIIGSSYVKHQVQLASQDINNKSEMKSIIASIMKL